jgi:hypothetical protein
MMTALTDDLMYQYKDESTRLIEVWIAEKHLYLSSNDFLDFFKKPVDGMGAIQT